MTYRVSERFRVADHVGGVVRDRVSGKFRFTGEVVAIRKEEVIHVITVLVGNHAVNAVASDDDVRELKVGDRVVLFSKAFNPIIMKVS